MSVLFQDELSYLRDVGREFSRQNPKLAKYLSDSSTDPDVERLLEGFAFLTSRVREKIDDEMSEFTHSVISLLWPNFLRPFPSTTLLKFTPQDRAITAHQIVPRNTVFLSRPVHGTICQFRTTADCSVYPIDITDIRLERTRDSSHLRLSFTSLSGLPVSGMGISDLRLTLAGDAATRQMLYLWLSRYVRSLRVSSAGAAPRPLDHTRRLQPIAFAKNEAILPQKNTAFDGHRLLQEYFVFPDKFYGYDLPGLGDVLNGFDADHFDLEIEFDRALPSDIRVRPDSLQLYCVPAVNLFPIDAEPLIIDHRKASYRIRPHGFAETDAEIFSIDEVTSQRASDDVRRTTRERVYPPFESFDHEIGEGWKGEQVYYRSRAAKALKRSGLDHDLSFVLHNAERAVPADEALSISLTCFNRDCAAELGVGDVSVRTQTSPSFMTVTNIVRPTQPVYPPMDGTLNWNLISNLSLNYMSLLSRDALCAILAIYDHRSAADRQAERAARQRLDGIRDLTTRPVDRLFKGLPIRGLKSRMVLKESCFQTEGEMYLFAAVLAEFFSLYASVNSFHELEVLGEDYGEIYSWTPRIGRQPLI